MALSDTLAIRAAVLAYLIHVDNQAEGSIVEGMTGDKWEAASRAWCIARANLIEAKTGKGWERHVKAAKRAGYH